MGANNTDAASQDPAVVPDHADAAVRLAGAPFQQMVNDTTSPPKVPGLVVTTAGGCGIS